MTGSIARIFSKPAEVVANFVDSVDNLMNTYEENQSLKSKIDTVYELQVKVYNLEQENARMQEELELKSTLSEYEQINASVVSRNPDSWLNQIVIDSRSQDGVEVDMSVMAGNGLDRPCIRSQFHKRESAFVDHFKRHDQPRVS